MLVFMEKTTSRLLPELIQGLKLVKLCPQGLLSGASVRLTYQGEVGCILAEQPGEDSLSLDALLVLKHVAVHETVQHGGVGMDINVEVQTDSLMEEKRGWGGPKKRTERDGVRERHTGDKNQQVSVGEMGVRF